MERKNTWSEINLRHLKDNHVLMPGKEIEKCLNQTDCSVVSTENLICSRRRGWTEDDVNWLMENYPTASYDDMIKRLNRKKDSIVAKASQLGVRRRCKNSLFTDEEIELIKKHWATMDENDFVAQYMPHRTTKSVQTKASKLGVMRRLPWTFEEDEILRSLYTTTTIKEISNILDGRTTTAIYNRLVKLGLTDAPTFAYSDEDIEFIRSNYMNMSDKEIGDILHRAPQSIKECRRKHRILRLKPERRLSYYDLEEFLHRNNQEWRKRAMRYDNYKCALTGEPMDVVHHMYGNNLILEEFYEHITIPDGFEIQTSTEEERMYLLNEYLKIENKYPMGICLSETIHKQFHGIYGYGNNTPEQFYEFVNNVAPDKIDRLMA